MIIDPSGRGPSMRQLLVAGTVGLLILVLALVMLVMRYRGDFADKVTVTANMTTTGDGLPQNADVKFRGILVGSVKSVQVAALGELQRVDIAMKPQYAGDVPQTVTARVVPSNVFAVTSIELLDNGPRAGRPMGSEPGLHNGSQIGQDTSHGTIALQSTLSTVRNVLDKIDPIKLGNILGTLSAAFDASGRMPGSTIERLDHWIVAIRAAEPNFGADLDNFSAAAHALNQSEPELVDTLSRSVKVASDIAARRAQLEQLLMGGGGAVDTVNTLFARNPNVGKDVVGGLNTTFGSLAQDPSAIPQSIGNLDTALGRLDSVFRWGPSGQMVWRAGASFSPFTPYARADCPRYESLSGPSCGNAPITADPGTLPPSLQPHSLNGQHYLPAPGSPIPTAAPAGGPVPAGSSPLARTPLAGLFPFLGGPR